MTLVTAIGLYSKAANASPEDPAPYSNLYAAHYELGQYSDCIQNVQTALSKPGSELDETNKKLATRLIKSYLHTKDYEAAKKQLDISQDLTEWKMLHAVYSREKHGSSGSFDVNTSRKEIICRLPRYLPTLTSNTEYYTVGHDKACSQVDASMLDKKNSPVSLFFGGIGDARNLYATLIDIVRLERSSHSRKTRTYHATINDIKANALVRDLVVFYLLDDLSALKGCKSEKRAQLLETIFFLYVGAIVPKYVSDRIQHTISRVILALQSGNDILKWVHVYERDKAKLIASLTSWQGELRSKYGIADLTTPLRNHVEAVIRKYANKIGEEKPRKGCKEEMSSF